MAKFNMNPLKNPMPTQEPDVRNGNFALTAKTVPAYPLVP